jgi:ABC-2 type transport system permease protein
VTPSRFGFWVLNKLRMSTQNSKLKTQNSKLKTLLSMSTVGKYWAVYSVMLRNSLIRDMNFKLNFLLWMVVESLWFVGQLVFIDVIFSHVNQIGDWTKWQMVLLVGTHQIISQIFQGFFYVNLINLPELV